MDGHLETIIQKISSGNNEEIKQGESFIYQWENESFSGYLSTLCLYICNGHRSVNNRVLAGLMFNNALSPKDSSLILQKQQKWFNQFDEKLKSNMKIWILNLLAVDEPRIRSIASQIIGTIAIVDLPAGKWPDLIRILLNNVTNQIITPAVKQATLDCFAYIIQSIEPKVIVNNTSEILTAVVQGLREKEVIVKRSAIKALYSSMEFYARDIFYYDERATEREVLMTVILDSATSVDEEIVCGALEILSLIALDHYHRLLPYIQKIFMITLEDIKFRPENIAKQAIEFWTTLAETERTLLERIKSGYPNCDQIQNFTKGVISHLVPLLTEVLPVKEGDLDNDEYTVHQAAALCISYISITVESDILPFIVPYIEANFNSPDWRRREAAVLAFSNILELPQDKVGSLVIQALPFLIQIMQDPNSKTLLKDTTAYTIGLIVKYHHERVHILSENVLAILCDALKDKPRVATNAAWAIHNFAYAYQKESINPLNNNFRFVIQLLVTASERPDAEESNLRSKIFEAINMLITVSSPQQLPVVEELLKYYIDKLESFYRDVSKQPNPNLQGLFCSTIQVIAHRMERSVRPYCDRIMNLIYRIFKNSNMNSDIHEESYLIVSELALVLGSEFIKYMAEFLECLFKGLLNFHEYQVCQAAVGLVGDIARSLKGQFSPYCERILPHLLQLLQRQDIYEDIKPLIITSIGDIAIALGPYFGKHFDVTMSVLKEFGDAVMRSAKDEDDLDYCNSFRESIFEAYTGIFQTLVSARSADKILPHLNTSILPLVNNTFMDKNHSEEAAVAAIGFLGDIANALGIRIKSTLSQPSVLQWIDQTQLKSSIPDTKLTCDFARKAIQSHA